MFVVTGLAGGEVRWLDALQFRGVQPLLGGHWSRRFWQRKENQTPGLGGGHVQIRLRREPRRFGVAASVQKEPPE